MFTNALLETEWPSGAKHWVDYTLQILRPSKGCVVRIQTRNWKQKSTLQEYAYFSDTTTPERPKLLV